MPLLLSLKIVGIVSGFAIVAYTTHYLDKKFEKPCVCKEPKKEEIKEIDNSINSAALCESKPAEIVWKYKNQGSIQIKCPELKCETQIQDTHHLIVGKNGEKLPTVMSYPRFLLGASFSYNDYKNPRIEIGYFLTPWLSISVATKLKNIETKSIELGTNVYF